MNCYIYPELNKFCKHCFNENIKKCSKCDYYCSKINLPTCSFNSKKNFKPNINIIECGRCNKLYCEKCCSIPFEYSASIVHNSDFNTMNTCDKIKVLSSICEICGG